MVSLEINRTNVDSVMGAVLKLTVLESAALIKELQQIFGIDPSIQQITASKSKSEDIVADKEKTEAVEVEEKNSFDLYLLEFPLDKKIAVLKAVRNVTGLGLKESKDIVDGIPKLVKEGLTKDQTELIKKEFESLGAKIEIK